MKQTTSRHQFTFYHSYIDCVMALPKCRRFETLLALIFYALDGEEPQLSGPSEAVFRAIRPNVDSSRSKAEAVLRTREKAQGEQEPRPGETAPESAAEAKAKAKKKFKSESENETETEKEKEIESSALAAPGGRSGGRLFGALSFCCGERSYVFFGGRAGGPGALCPADGGCLRAALLADLAEQVAERRPAHGRGTGGAAEDPAGDSPREAGGAADRPDPGGGQDA